MQFGSHVYGTSLPTSDTDYKGVHIPDVRDMLLQRVKPAVSEKTKTDPNARNTAEDIDFESFPLQQFMKLLLEGQTIAVDMLFTSGWWIVESSHIWDEIVEQKDLWLHRGVSAFVGYCRQQAAKYGIRGSRVAAVRGVLGLIDSILGPGGVPPIARLSEVWRPFVAYAAKCEHAQIVERVDIVNGAEVPVRFLEVCGRKVSDHMTLKHARDIYQKVFDAYGQRALAAEQNQGVDWKALMHAVRVIGEAEELLTTGTITFPRPDAPLLLQVRKGELPYKQVAELIEEGVERVEKLGETSSLREEPDREAAEELVLRVYGDRALDAAFERHGFVRGASFADHARIWFGSEKEGVRGEEK